MIPPGGDGRSHPKTRHRNVRSPRTSRPFHDIENSTGSHNERNASLPNTTATTRHTTKSSRRRRLRRRLTFWERAMQRYNNPKGGVYLVVFILTSLDIISKIQQFLSDSSMDSSAMDFSTSPPVAVPVPLHVTQEVNDGGTSLIDANVIEQAPVIDLQEPISFEERRQAFELLQQAKDQTLTHPYDPSIGNNIQFGLIPTDEIFNSKPLSIIYLLALELLKSKSFGVILNWTHPYLMIPRLL